MQFSMSVNVGWVECGETQHLKQKVKLLRYEKSQIICKAAEIIIRRRRVLDLFLDPFRKLKQGGLQL
jgi:hypothetical protein